MLPKPLGHAIQGTPAVAFRWVDIYNRRNGTASVPYASAFGWLIRGCRAQTARETPPTQRGAAMKIALGIIIGGAAGYLLSAASRSMGGG